jgi:hypothetical protein
MSIVKALGAALLALTLLSAAGCAVVPMQRAEVDHVALLKSDGTQLSIEDVEKAIRSAARVQGWAKLEQVSPGHIVATKRELDSWWASVDILYSATEFSIHYKDSEGLRYNPHREVIAHEYKSQVGDLRDEILNIAITGN